MAIVLGLDEVRCHDPLRKSHAMGQRHKYKHKDKDGTRLCLSVLSQVLGHVYQHASFLIPGTFHHFMVKEYRQDPLG